MEHILVFVQNNPGSVIAIAIALVTIVVNYIYYIVQLQKNVKMFVGPTVKIFEDFADEKGKFKILFDGEPVKNVRVTGVTIKNFGRHEIKVDDYFDPLEVHFGDNSTVLDVKEVYSKPDNLHMDVFWHRSENGKRLEDKTRIRFDKVLLNPGDAIEFKVIVSDCLPDVCISKPDGRIAGNKTIYPRPYLLNGFGIFGGR